MTFDLSILKKDLLIGLCIRLILSAETKKRLLNQKIKAFFETKNANGSETLFVRKGWRQSCFSGVTLQATFDFVKRTTPGL